MSNVSKLSTRSKMSNVSRLSVPLKSYVPWKSSSIEDCHALSFFRCMEGPAKELTHEVSTQDSTKSPSSKIKSHENRHTQS